VRDRRRELAHRGEALAADELVASPLQELVRARVLERDGGLVDEGLEQPDVVVGIEGSRALLSPRRRMPIGFSSKRTGKRSEAPSARAGPSGPAWPFPSPAIS
jgi:hypothetical protein